MKKDGSLSWIVISRRMNKYVEKRIKMKSVHHEEIVTGSGTEKPVATKQKGQSRPQSYLVSKMFLPIDQGQWKDIPAVDDVRKRSLSWRVSKIMTNMLRHHGVHREDGGASD